MQEQLALFTVAECPSCAAEVSQLLSAYLGGVDREHFVLFMVDRKNQVIGINTVSVGCLDGVIVHPREV